MAAFRAATGVTGATPPAIVETTYSLFDSAAADPTNPASTARATPTSDFLHQGISDVIIRKQIEKGNQSHLRDYVP